MFGLNLLYIFSIGMLICFGGAFFTTELYFPKILKWKANQLFVQSQVYLDEDIDNTGGLLDDGVQKAKIAHLLDPENMDLLFNFLRLQYRISPAQSLLGWSSAIFKQEEKQLRTELLEKSFMALRNPELPTHERKIGGEVAFREINILNEDEEWSSNPENKIKFCELLAETGQSELALEHSLAVLEEFPDFPEAIFLVTRLSTHLEDSSRLVDLGRGLAALASQQSEIGIKAIRHMTLLHLLNPLSPQSLDKCIQLLNANPYSRPIDFMRIYALSFGLTAEDKRNEIVLACASLFDLEDSRDTFVFNQWLARLGDYQSILNFLPAHKARVDENLFKLRMSALARAGEFEKIHAEIAQATLIPSEWKLVVESRAFAMTGHFDDALSSLERLIPIIESDPRDVRSICDFLETSKDIRGLCHLLEYFVGKPIHARFALTKLLQYRSGSASAGELVKWLEKLSEISPEEKALNVSITYLKLLDKNLASPSSELTRLLAEAQNHAEDTNLPQAKIALALAHFRNKSPDRALVALGSPSDWRFWANTRPAWAFFAAQIYRLNHDSEKALVLQKSFNEDQIDFAERDGLSHLFPDHFVK